MPPVVDPERKASCEFDLGLFQTTYIGNAFKLEAGDHHLELNEYLEGVIIDGEKQALAFPRGDGKTTTCISAAAWGIAYGHVKFVVVIAANDSQATKIMKNIKQIFKSKIFAEDFPEISFPIIKLENIATRCSGQLLNGKPTNMKWNDSETILPTIEGSAASGARIVVGGITGSGIRGLLEFTEDLEALRPDCAIVDDFQTKQSAKSQGADGQCQKLLDIIQNDIAGMEGQDRPMGMMVPCTIIEPGDAAEQIVDPDRYPEFNGMRIAALTKMPENLDWWTDTYFTILKKCDRAKVEHKKSEARRKAEWKKVNRADKTAKFEKTRKTDKDFYQPAIDYYLDNRAEMDNGFECSWDNRKKHWASGTQFAMNMYLRNQKRFWCEYQNDPGALIDENDIRLRPEVVVNNTNGLARKAEPEGFGIETMAIDLNDYGLNCAHVFWRLDMTGNIADYFEYTPHDRGYVFKNDMNLVREVEFSNALKTLITKWAADHPQCLIGVDGNWQTQTVHNVVSELKEKGIKVEVMRGVHYKKFNEPDSRNKRLYKRGNKSHLWQGPKGREIVFESDWWHMTTQGGFKINSPLQGSLSLWGKDGMMHTKYALECTNDVYKHYNPADYNKMYIKSNMGGRNDKFDATSMCQVLANMNGARFDYEEGQGEQKYYSLADQIRKNKKNK